MNILTGGFCFETSLLRQIDLHMYVFCLFLSSSKRKTKSKSISLDGDLCIVHQTFKFIICHPWTFDDIWGFTLYEFRISCPPPPQWTHTKKYDDATRSQWDTTDSVTCWPEFLNDQCGVIQSCHRCQYGHIIIPTILPLAPTHSAHLTWPTETLST